MDSHAIWGFFVGFFTSGVLNRFALAYARKHGWIKYVKDVDDIKAEHKVRLEVKRGDKFKDLSDAEFELLVKERMLAELERLKKQRGFGRG